METTPRGSFDILVDTTADLERPLREAYGIEYLPGHLTIDGRDGESFTEWTTISREEFHTSLKEDPGKYKTSPPSVGELAKKMEASVTRGRGVLYVCISSALSGGYSFAVQAKKLVEQTVPDADIRCIDSMRFGPAIGLMAVNAAVMRDAGKSLSEVALAVEKEKNRYHQAGWLDDLSFVAKQGRITHAKAFFGTLAGVKPIGEFDYNGMTTVLGKVKGEKAAMRLLLDYIARTIEEPEKQIIFVAQTNRKKQAETYRALIEERFHPRSVVVKDVYPSCGTNVGPGLMAAYYMGTEISADLSAERGIIKELLGGSL